MGLDNVIKLALALTLAAAMTGQLPKVTREIQIAQIKLLHESQASRWGSPDLLFRNQRTNSRINLDF